MFHIPSIWYAAVAAPHANCPGKEASSGFQLQATGEESQRESTEGVEVMLGRIPASLSASQNFLTAPFMPSRSCICEKGNKEFSLALGKISRNQNAQGSEGSG